MEETTIPEVPSKENQPRHDTNQAKTKENPAAEQSTPQGPIQGPEETPTMLLTTPRKSKHEAQWATYHGRQAWTTPRRRRSSNGELSLKVSTPEVPDYNAMKVPQLKKLCKGRRLTQGGIRQELIDKLEKDDKGRRELKIRTIVTPKRSRGGNIIVPTRDNEYGNDDYDPHKSPTLQTPSKKARKRPPDKNVVIDEDVADVDKDDDDDDEDDIVPKGRIPNESQPHDDEYEGKTPQILEELPPNSTNKINTPGEKGGNREGSDIHPSEVHQVHQHQNEGSQVHRQGEG